MRNIINRINLTYALAAATAGVLVYLATDGELDVSENKAMKGLSSWATCISNKREGLEYDHDSWIDRNSVVQVGAILSMTGILPIKSHFDESASGKVIEPVGKIVKDCAYAVYDDVNMEDREVFPTFFPLIRPQF